MRFLRRRGKGMTPTNPGTTDAPAPHLLEESGEAPPAEPHRASPRALPQKGGAWSLQRLGHGISQSLRRCTTTLSVENGVVRVVVVKGREVLAWGTVNLEEEREGEEESIAQDQDERDADRLQALLKELHVRRGRLVTDLPLYTPLMRRLQLPKIRRGYLEQVVLSEVTETIPFSQDEVDITWQYRRNGTDQEVFAIAVPKKTVDDHVRLLKKANIRPAAAYSKAMALAFTAGVPDAIVAHLGPSQATIFLVRGKAPLVVHQVELPEGDTGPQEQAEAVARAVELVDSYYQPFDSKDEGQPLPVVLSGQLTRRAPLVEALQHLLEREVLPFASPFVYPDHFPPSEYAANLGLALADRARTKARGKLPKQKAPSVNLLSERHLPQPLPIRPVAAFVALLLFAIVAFNTTAPVDAVVSTTAELSTRLATLQRQERLHQLSLSHARTIEKRTQAVNQLADGSESLLVDLQDQMYTFLVRADTLTQKALPPNVELSTFLLEGDSFVLTGTAYTYQDAFYYRENLRASRFFTNVNILQIMASETASVTFHLKASVASP